jgi:hypothetical protein
LDESTGLPTVSTTAQLKYNERAFYCAPTALYETLTVQYYGADVFCCEIAPGMWVGGFQDWSYSREQLTKLDSGTLTITSQRLIFDGAEVALAIPLQRIVSVQPFHDSVDIAFGSGDVNLIFKALNPLILASVIRLSCGGYDDLTRRAEQARQASAGNGTSSNGAAYYSQPPPPNPQPKKSRERPAPEIPKIDCEDLIHARTLGLSGKFDFAIVKKHYYDRIREYHPDKVAALGPQLRELAETESKKINAAYEFLSRKLKSSRKS